MTGVVFLIFAALAFLFALGAYFDRPRKDKEMTHEHYFRPGIPDVKIGDRTFRYFRCECGDEYGSEMFGSDVPADDHQHEYTDVSLFADADAGRHTWECHCGARTSTRDRA